MSSHRSRRRGLRRRHRAKRGHPALATKFKTLSFEHLEDRRLLAAFDWFMTPRLLVDSDGRIAVPNNSSYADPGTFEVVFNGTAAGNHSYDWSVTDSGGNNFTSLDAVFRPRLEEGSCAVTFTFDGTPTTTNIMINDILIVTMGDSLSAGEGNPEVPDRNDPEWMQVGDTSFFPATPDSSPTGPELGFADVEEEQARYHEIASRSSWAAGAQMARQVEEADPHTSVTFVFVASSGASIGGLPGTQKPGIGGGALSEFAGQSPGEGYDENDPMPSQIAQVHNIVKNRPIDIMTFSFGVNDVQPRHSSRCRFQSSVVAAVTLRQLLLRRPLLRPLPLRGDHDGADVPCQELMCRTCSRRRLYHDRRDRRFRFAIISPQITRC